MDNKNIKNEETEINLSRLFGALLKRAWLIAIVAVVCAIATLIYTVLFVTPKYKSGAMFYVNNSSVDLGVDLNLSASDISASQSLVNTYIVILNTRETLTDVIDYAGVDRSVGAVRGMITATTVGETQIFQVVVTSEDPEEAEKIADAIAYVLPKRITSIVEGTSTKVVDAAVLPTSASSPSYTKNAMFGFLIGFVLAAGVIVVLELLDVTIRTEEDIVQNCKHPVLATVPDMEMPSKGGYYYGHNRQKGAYERRATQTGKQTEVIGGNISFAAAEAYKLLRTKLQFSFADEGDCRVIGISSALTGEGKSLTAINLAYSMAQLGKRVLLVDCDMRRPSLASKLPIERSPGLSDYLSGQNTDEEIVQSYSLKKDNKAFQVIAAGRTPPNPMELLSSARMEKMIAQLREHYDYVILDLPPVGEVGDALASAKLTDGVLLIVRQNYCDRVVLNTTIRQFEFVDAKILGVVYNAVVNESRVGLRKYGKYYRNYYRRYYRQSSTYEAAAQAVKEAEQA